MHRMYTPLLFLLGLQFLVVSSLPCDLSNQFCILAWNQQCPEEDLNVISLDGTSYSLRNYDILSFGDVDVATNGFIEGRVAIENNFQAGDNVTIGRAVSASNGDISLPYSLIVGRDAQWSSGELYPTASSDIGQEGAWIGGQFNTNSSNLASRRTGGPCSATGCLDQYFSSAQIFWEESSNRMNQQVSNAQVNLAPDKTTIACVTPTATIYFLFVDGGALSSFQQFDVQGCSNTAMFVMNVVGSSLDISLNGEAFKFGNGVIYNVIGMGRTITTNTDVYGYIINTWGTVTQASGTIYGQVVATNINALSIARFTCPSSITPVPSPSNSSSTTVIVTPTTGGTTNNDTNNGGAICPFVDSDVAACSQGFLIVDGGTSYSLEYYHVVSFGDVAGDKGDIEGRLAARGTVTFGDHFSVGDKIVTSSTSSTSGNVTDRYSPFSLIARSLSWVGGNLFPDGLHSSAIEGIYIADGDLTRIVSYLQSRVTYSCSDPTCLDSAFDEALECSLSTQQHLANQTNNVAYAMIDSQLLFTCTDLADRYYVTIPSSALSNSSYYGLHNCSSDAEWVITVLSDDDVYFLGDSFPATPEKVLYNIVGSGRTIYASVEVNGAILSPQNILSQSSGVIHGKVIVGSISSLKQINKPRCPSIEIDVVEESFHGDASFTSPSWLVLAVTALTIIIF